MQRRLEIFSSSATHKISSSFLLILAYLCNRQINKLACASLISSLSPTYGYNMLQILTH